MCFSTCTNPKIHKTVIEKVRKINALVNALLKVTLACVLLLQAVNSRGQHSISFTLSRNQTVVVEYCHDNNTDMFQVNAAFITSC